jgi:hypothetical protein
MNDDEDLKPGNVRRKTNWTHNREDRNDSSGGGGDEEEGKESSSSSNKGNDSIEETKQPWDDDDGSDDDDDDASAFAHASNLAASESKGNSDSMDQAKASSSGVSDLESLGGNDKQEAAQQEEKVKPKKVGRRRKAEEDSDEALVEKARQAAVNLNDEPGVGSGFTKRTTAGWGNDDDVDNGDINATNNKKKNNKDNEDEKEVDQNDHNSSAARGDGTEGKRKGRKNHFANDDDGDIMIIPDLEEEQEEDITVQVAAAPKNLTRKVATLFDLDNDLKHSISSAAGGLDMSLLTEKLVPPGKVQEEDVEWDFDTLLQSVTQEFHQEKEESEESNGDGNEENVDGNGSSSATAGESGGKSAAAPAASSFGAGVRQMKEEDARKLDEGLGLGGDAKKNAPAAGRRVRKG